MRRLLMATVLMVIPGVAWAGGGGVDTTGCAGFGEGGAVVMKDSCFAGTAHFVPANTTITVTNEGQLPHTLTAVDGSFDTGSVGAGSSAELVIDEPGIYRVICSLHGTAQGDGMAGVLVVGDASTAQFDSAGTSRDDLGVVAGGAPADSPPAVISGRGVEPTQLVILLVVGLALGLALAAMLTALRVRIGEGAPAMSDR